MKVCNDCFLDKNDNEFYIKKTGKLYPYCKDCLKIRSKKDYEANPEKFRNKSKIFRLKNPNKYRNSQLKIKFGITLETYNKMLEDQKCECACCGLPENMESKNFAVDHCHKSGIIRGLLCSKCNTTLGNVKDSTEWLQKLITYLEKTNEKSF